MEPSTTEGCHAEAFVPERASAERLPWPVAAMAIAGLAGTLWAVVGLLAVQIFT
jgi:hypothetical protein